VLVSTASVPPVVQRLAQPEQYVLPGASEEDKAAFQVQHSRLLCSTASTAKIQLKCCVDILETYLQYIHEACGDQPAAIRLANASAMAGVSASKVWCPSV
jgi:hypothetical protein